MSLTETVTSPPREGEPAGLWVTMMGLAEQNSIECPLLAPDMPPLWSWSREVRVASLKLVTGSPCRLFEVGHGKSVLPLWSWSREVRVASLKLVTGSPCRLFERSREASAGSSRRRNKVKQAEGGAVRSAVTPAKRYARNLISKLKMKPKFEKSSSFQEPIAREECCRGKFLSESINVRAIAARQQLAFLRESAPLGQ